VGCSAVSLPNARTAARGHSPFFTNRAVAGYCSKGILFFFLWFYFLLIFFCEL
jgi:hypothetical protein